ncbi:MULTISPECIES: nuclease-related domain-containing protein [Bacillaceae]|uniref:nuclease-related domain-containing protein n=1 Tax=Bacillaceae TaxID=186817 RepID=UPI001C580E53|nr:nuclease-related domain-containing protein [Rossellomorea sp. YZS02]MBW3114775.1 NERD domain-containing protein [Bacillus sp. MCCB 382]MDX8345290.1 nuclease-related domain-containing protein [Rossellomorea sp. YZS02]
MAQLIKLQDYVSRYETDLYRYPSQFVRLKKQQWEKMKQHWENGDLPPAPPSVKEEEEKDSVKEKLFSLFKKKDAQEEEPVLQPSDEEMVFEMERNQDIHSEEELKVSFLNLLFDFQLKWASSTIMEKSYVDNSYRYDERLRYLLQRFPDNIFVMYNPVLKIKNAPVELETILITPTGIWCLTFLEFEEGTAYIGSGERFWVKKWGDMESKVLNPLIGLKRMERIIHQIIRYAGVELPIYQAVISRNGYIDYPQSPAGIQFLDKRIHNEWFQQQRSSSSPIKSVQLKAAQAIMEYCQITSFKRLQWEEEQEVAEGDQA